ncbi:MAG: hypothetical protein J6P61_02105 [Erysipelotrichaceae bacterium]|nr:hypothetical protein [Erysipelotrichaceae bacterium]
MFTTYLIEMMNHEMHLSPLNHMMLEVMNAYCENKKIQAVEHLERYELTFDETVVLASMPLYQTKDFTFEEHPIYDGLIDDNLKQVVLCWIRILEAVDRLESPSVFQDIIENMLVNDNEYTRSWKRLFLEVIQYYDYYDQTLNEIIETDSYILRMLLVELLSINIESDNDISYLFTLYFDDEARHVFDDFIACFKEEKSILLNQLTQALIMLNTEKNAPSFTRVLEEALNDDSIVYIVTRFNKGDNKWISFKSKVDDDKELLVIYTDLALITRKIGEEIIPIPISDLFLSMNSEDVYDGLLINPETKAQIQIFFSDINVKVS